MAGILLEQPSKINNLGYFILGLYIASLIRYNITLTLEQQIAFIITFGGFIGTLVYYIKPVEKLVLIMMPLFNHIQRRVWQGRYDIMEHEIDIKSEEYGRQLYKLWRFAPNISKRDVFYSNFLADDRTIINGIFFLSFGLLTSNPILKSVELGNYYQAVRVIAILLLFVGLWNIYELIQSKMPPLIFLYLNYNLSANKEELVEALGVRDWLRSRKIMEKEPLLHKRVIGWPLSYQELIELTSIIQVDDKSIPGLNKGICFKCEDIVDANKYCPLCGNMVINKCINCSKQLIEENIVNIPTFCNYCGEDIETMFLWLLGHNIYKSNIYQFDNSRLVSVYHKSKEILNRYKDYIFNNQYQIGHSIALDSFVKSDYREMSPNNFLWDYFNLVLIIPFSNKEMIEDIILAVKLSCYRYKIKKIICNIDDTFLRTNHIVYEGAYEDGRTLFTIIVESADTEIKKKIEIINNILEREE